MCTVVSAAPKLAQLQSRKKEVTKAKVAGVQIKSLLELSQFLLPLLMPPSLNEIQQSLNNTALNAATNAMKKVLHIPLVAA
eukprot:1667443-Prymnesium_polylepis.1